LLAANSAIVSALRVYRVLVSPITTTAFPAEWVATNLVSWARLSAREASSPSLVPAFVCRL
jgi:hypothetical protein